MTMKSHNGVDTVSSREATDWGPTRTQQSAKDQCNINLIMKRAESTGTLTHISRELAQYRDMSNIPDLADGMAIVADANSAFAELPADVRKAVGHDVGNFLPFIDNPDNYDECVTLGLLPANEPNIVPIPPITDPMDGENTPEAT